MPHCFNPDVFNVYKVERQIEQSLINVFPRNWQFYTIYKRESEVNITN
jgi:hypothetical protein